MPKDPIRMVPGGPPFRLPRQCCPALLRWSAPCTRVRTHLFCLSIHICLWRAHRCARHRRELLKEVPEGRARTSPAAPAAAGEGGSPSTSTQGALPAENRRGGVDLPLGFICRSLSSTGVLAVLVGSRPFADLWFSGKRRPRHNSKKPIQSFRAHQVLVGLRYMCSPCL
jgi:hypothetical protein